MILNDQTKQIADNGWSVPDFMSEALSPKGSRHVVLIPVINEGDRIRRQLADMHDIGLHEMMDIVVVDGGSTDGSLEHKDLKAVGVRALLTKTGPGKLSAQLRCGYAWALLEGYDGIITIDGNGKDGVDTLPDFAAALEQGYGYVQASRFVKGGRAVNTPWLRAVSIRLLHAPLLSLAAGHWFTDTTQGYRGYSADYLRDERVQPFRDVFMRYELLAYLTVRASQLGYKVKELPTARIYPKGEATPTKITGVGPWVNLVFVALRALFGIYHPPGTKR